MENRLRSNVREVNRLAQNCSWVVAGSDSKASVYRYRRPGFNPWVGKIVWRKKWQPTPVLLPRKSHGWRSLLQATVHGVTESDSTERFHFSGLNKMKAKFSNHWSNTVFPFYQSAIFFFCVLSILELYAIFTGV